jgi:cellulose synthase/poly-beta-1,6-N-acetylglucosamine synthase-like glycosyltransferase
MPDSDPKDETPDTTGQPEQQDAAAEQPEAQAQESDSPAAAEAAATPAQSEFTSEPATSDTPATSTDNTTKFLGPRGIQQATFTVNTWQRIGLIALAIGIIAALVTAWTPTLIILNAVFTVFFLASTIYRVYIIDVALRRQAQIVVEPDELIAPDGEWPYYVIQVPLYKEKHAVPHIIESLGSLDYPRDRYTVQLLVEEDDEETKGAVSKVEIKPPFVVVNIPVSYPRTKPKACNVGLAAAEGDYLVIYDAEDRPDKDQLKKAVVAFSRCEKEVTCIQAKLNFYNTDRNLITRLFTAEYSMWYDLCLPGLDYLRAPIPLGGTSNHFRLDILKQLQGWDEYNVTEDCDLGLRLFMDGWRTRILDSTTWEEACPRLFPWFRQRSRWVKGYLQTYLVHTRSPLKITKHLGFANSVHFHLLIGGSVFNQLLAPVYWLLVAVWLVSRPEGLGQYFPASVFLMGSACLFLGTFYLVYSCAVACIIRKSGRVVKYTPLMLLYWMAMSWAAWKGTLQLIWNPHYWEKTEHNVDDEE